MIQSATYSAWRSLSLLESIILVTLYSLIFSTNTTHLLLKQLHVGYRLKVPNIVVRCHRDESSMRRQHLFAALSQHSAHTNTLTLRAASETGDRICPPHQIETFRMKYCQNINVGFACRARHTDRVLHQRGNTLGFYRQASYGGEEF